MLKRAVLAILAVAVIAAIAFAVLAWRPAIAPAEARAAAFDPALVRKGESLAAVGNCIACHTLPGGRAFAGGLALPTPFGTIYSSNITPDPETGIGRWNEAAFQRAMNEGVDREGNHLYPAFPYDHFTLVSAEDNKALYAYLMTREPVQAQVQANALAFPYNIRPLLAGWKLLFLRKGPYEADASKSAEWNRGAYLAEGLGHCGSCHTPRNALGAEDRSKKWAGGEAEGWQAYAINAASPAPVPWDKDKLAFYLRNGYHQEHGVSRGPMAEVTGNLAELSDEDVAAIGTYVADMMGKPGPERSARAEQILKEVAAGPGAQPAEGDSQQPPPASEAMPGAAIYASACATCHGSGRPLPYGGLDFRLSTAVNAPNPQNIVNVTLFGLPPSDGEASAIMPAFAGSLSDRQVADLLAYLRSRFAPGREAWTGVEDMAKRTRSGEYKVTVRPADGIERSPYNVGAKAP